VLLQLLLLLLATPQTSTAIWEEDATASEECRDNIKNGAAITVARLHFCNHTHHTQLRCAAHLQRLRSINFVDIPAETVIFLERSAFINVWFDTFFVCIMTHDSRGTQSGDHFNND
jgi:hypothetical protein